MELKFMGCLRCCCGALLGLLGSISVASGQFAEAAVASGPSASMTRAPVGATGLQGAIGGLHVLDARVAAPGSVGLQLALGYFSTDNFLFPGDEHERLGGSLSLSWSMNPHVELFAAVAGHTSHNSQADPQNIAALGDAGVGVKWVQALSPWLAAGASARLLFLNTLGEVGPDLSATSFGLRALATADLRRLSTQVVPLLIRANVGYYFDNSAQLIDDLEAERGANLSEFSETSLANRAERFGLGVNRVDQLQLGLGVEVPLELSDDLSLAPLGEYTLGLPINRQGYTCPIATTDASIYGADGCWEFQGLAAVPAMLTVGARFRSQVARLGVWVALDLGLAGVDTFVRELAPTAPYQLRLAISYALGLGDAASAQLPAATYGRIAGQVVSAADGQPLDGAIIGYPGKRYSQQLADSDGRFESYALPPGLAEVEVQLPGYATRRCAVEIPEHGVEDRLGVVPLRCALSPLGLRLAGLVVDEEGSPLADIELRVSGPRVGSKEATLQTDSQGHFSRQGFPPGRYRVVAGGQEWLRTATTVAVDSRRGPDPAPITLRMLHRPAEPHVHVQQNEVVVDGTLRFDEHNKLVPDQLLLREVVDALLAHPEFRHVEVQGHTDNSGDPDLGQVRTQAAAEAVRAALIADGVDESRLVAKGYGDTMPLVPNLTPANRELNRRIQFVRVGDGAAGQSRP